jgi:peptidoglycan/xylan/chitin deacetylase (PgdA/CDA1 family)
VSPRRSRGERVAAILDLPGLRTLLARVPTWRGALVLNYHRVGTSEGTPWDRTLWSASAEGFDEQLAFLKRETDVVGPADLPALAAARRGRHVLITFDDGYRDNWEIAFPALRRRGLTATFFLATGFLDDPHVAWWDEIVWMVRNASGAVVPAGDGLPVDVQLAGVDPNAVAHRLVHEYKHLPVEGKAAYLDHVAQATGAGRCGPAEARGMWMSWDEARELRDGGMSIGGHTITHPVLGQLPAAEQEREIAGCAERLRAQLGEPMRWFSYPVGFPGSFDADTRRLLRAQDVELAFSFYGGHARFTHWDPLDVPRINVAPSLDATRLHAAVRLPQLFARAF